MSSSPPSTYYSQLAHKEVMTNMTGLDLTAKALTKMTRIYYSHQVEGMEKIPSNGAAILVWYHGAVPIDYIALVSRLYLRDARMVHSVVHRNFLSVPGFDLMKKYARLMVASREDCEDLLRAGEMMGVSVGGAEEAMFDWNYQPTWNRKGFAQVALNTGKGGEADWSTLIGRGPTLLRSSWSRASLVILVPAISCHKEPACRISIH